MKLLFYPQVIHVYFNANSFFYSKSNFIDNKKIKEATLIK